MKNQKHTVTVPELGITFGTGSLAHLANGAVTVQVGETTLFVSATAAENIKPGQDFFPLTVDYREKYSAAGRFPGGYFKREGRPSEKEILTSRLCDRPCRPLFPAGFLNEVQVIGLLLSADQINDADIPMVNGASAALAISDIPWAGPIAAVRVGRIDGQFVTNPTIEQMYSSDLDLIYVGTEKDMLMIEGSAAQLPEDDFIAALEYAHKAIQPIIAAIKQLVAIAGKPKRAYNLVTAKPEARAIVERIAAPKIVDAIFGKEKQVRSANVAALKEECKAALLAELGEGNFADHDISITFEDLQYSAYRKAVLERGVRADGRDSTSLRPITCEAGVLPRVHGSSMFKRGDTQTIVTTTLGPTKEAQDLDALTGGAKSKSFILHYNFPPYSVGETGRFGSPGRREVGHGALAERSLVPVLPPEDIFPYSIRVVSDIMASNGSTSMASICGGCLSLMDAGVPIIAPVAGISCGLMTENDATTGAITKWVTVTDILGEEDHFGDMDFKLAGTTTGITGFQLDLKINGLPFEIAKKAIYQARDARIEILKLMLASIPAPRAQLSAYAPRIQTIQIDPDNIGLLIGPGGKTIRRITETTGAQIDIAEDDSGKVFIYSNNADSMARAIQEIDVLCGGGAQIEVGKLYRGVVKGTKEFGAFVECMPGKEGLCHISELADFRVRRTEDVCKVGDEMWVKCIGIDERTGKVRLSRKAAMKEMEAKQQGGDAPPPAPAADAPAN